MTKEQLKKHILDNIGDVRYNAQYNFINKNVKAGQGENFVAICYIEALFDYLEKEKLTISVKDEKIKK